MRICPDCRRPLKCSDSRATKALLGDEEVPATRRRYICEGRDHHRHSSIEIFAEMERGRFFELRADTTPLERLLGVGLSEALRARLGA